MEKVWREDLENVPYEIEVDIRSVKGIECKAKRLTKGREGKDLFYNGDDQRLRMVRIDLPRGGYGDIVAIKWYHPNYTLTEETYWDKFVFFLKKIFSL